MIKRIGMGLALTLALAACGGGGGGGVSCSTNNAGFAPAIGSGTGGNLLTAVLDTCASTSSVLVFNMNLSNVDSSLNLSTTVAGVAADLTYDSTWMTFNSITGGPGFVAAAQDQGNVNKLVIGATDVAVGNVATLRFDIDTAATHNATMVLDNLALLGPSGTILPKHPMSAAAGTVTNTPPP